MQIKCTVKVYKLSIACWIHALLGFSTRSIQKVIPKTVQMVRYGNSNQKIWYATSYNQRHGHAKPGFRKLDVNIVFP